MTIADLAIIAGLVFAWGTLSARLERFDMTAPIVFTVAGVLLTHGPLAPLGITPGSEVVKVLAEATLALVLFSDASRVRLHQLQGVPSPPVHAAPHSGHTPVEPRNRRSSQPGLRSTDSRESGASYIGTASPTRWCSPPCLR